MKRKHGFRTAATLLLALTLAAGFCSCKRAGGEDIVPAPIEGKTTEDLTSDKYLRNADLVIDGVPYAKKTDVSAYLFMGIDKTGTLESTDQTTGGQSDVLLLIVLDSKAQKRTVIQINRDTIADVELLDFYGDPIGIERPMQICLSHSFGVGDKKSCENTVRAVSKLLMNTDIKGYVSFLYEAVPAVNDALGGIKVEITDDFSGVDSTLTMGKTVELKGQHALTYVRSRQSIGDGDNLDRMRRQKAYISAFMTRLQAEMKVRSAIINELYGAALPYMVTDMTVGKITNMAVIGMDYESGGIVSPKGEMKYTESADGNIYAEFYPEAESIRDMVLELFYDKID